MHRGEHGGRGEQGHCPRPKTRAPEHWPELVPSHPRASAFPKLCGLRLKVLLTDNTATSWRDGTMPAVGTALPPWAFTLSPLSDRWSAHAPQAPSPARGPSWPPGAGNREESSPAPPTSWHRRAEGRPAPHGGEGASATQAPGVGSSTGGGGAPAGQAPGTGTAAI